jgi:hypothetical protein
MKAKCRHTFSGPKLGLSLVIAVVVISSSIVMLVNPVLGAASTPPQSTDPTSFSVPSTIVQDGGGGGSDFTTQAALSSVTAKQSNNIVNTRSYYDITFTTGSGGSIKDIIIDFPSGTLIGVSGLLVEREGIGAGTAAKTGPLQITYTVTNPVNIPPGTTIRLELSTIDNPPDAGASYQIKVTTKRPAGTTIDGPTFSTAYKIKQVGTGDIADGAITSTKPAESFMKRVTVRDTPNGHAVGWNPNGATTTFVIDEPLVQDFDSVFFIIEVSSSVNHFCDVIGHTPTPNTFTIACSSAPSEFDILDYVVGNLPQHIIS